MRFLYNSALYLLALFALPKMLYDMVKKGKYRKSFLKRLGVGFPKVERAGRAVIWIHAVSLGETRAVGPLVKKLQQMPSKPLIVLSAATETGHREGRTNVASADYHVYLPLDFPFIVNPIVRRVAPDLVLVVETDFWPNFQQAAVKCGAKLILVNGKISERSYKLHLKFRRISKLLLGSFSSLCLQGPLYKKRFLDLGVDERKIGVTGNMKLDAVNAPVDTTELKRRMGIHEDDLVLTLGSTHDPEERLLLSAFQTLLPQFPKLKLIVVPRHPERFDEVACLIEEMGIDYVRFSRHPPSAEKRVVLMDTVGQLKSCYQISLLAFVGGSFKERVGGHNILEPCFYGVPTLFGPFMHGQPDFLELVKNYKAGRQLTYATLVPLLEELLKNKNLIIEMGQNGLKLISDSHGAIDRTMKEIEEHFSLTETSA
jgi:3-deoxy-D-manno-octulosonic-acid transferase